MTKRISLDEMTDDQLDALYARIDYLAGSTAALETYAAEQRERAERAEAALAQAGRVLDGSAATYPEEFTP